MSLRQPGDAEAIPTESAPCSIFWRGPASWADPPTEVDSYVALVKWGVSGGEAPTFAEYRKVR